MFPAMLAALLLATLQPPTLSAFLAPPSGTYGWIEQLAGSCFVERGPYGAFISECFSIREGRFVIASLRHFPRLDRRDECVLTSAREERLRFDCAREGGERYEMFAHYQGDAFVTRTASRQAAARSPRQRAQTLWRRLGEDRLSITVEMAGRDGVWRPSPLSRPRALTRGAVPAD